MDAVEFVKTVNRLCKNLRCKECPVYKEGICTIGFDDYSVESIEETVTKVEQWEKDHHIKTRQSEFLKMFPNADMQRIYTLFPCVMDQTIRPTRCVKYESFSSPKKCVECRKDYWTEEITDND